MDGTAVWKVDVFTVGGRGGNPAGVVADARGLSDADMQMIATAVGASETAFVMPALDATHDVFVRFFTPEREVPVCGHATLAAHVVLARLHGETEAQRVQRSPGAVWTVRCAFDGGRWQASMIQEPVLLGPSLEGAKARAAYQALGAVRPVVAPLPRVVSTGHAKMVVPVASIDVLRSLTPDAHVLRELSAVLGVDGWFVFALVEGEDDVRTECRMFAPALGLYEDPVNGSGHGPLAAYLVHHGLLNVGRDGRASFASRMGTAVGRAGRVHVTAEVVSGRVTRVHVSGEVMPARDATIPLTCTGAR